MFLTQRRFEKKKENFYQRIITGRNHKLATLCHVRLTKQSFRCGHCWGQRLTISKLAYAYIYQKETLVSRRPTFYRRRSSQHIKSVLVGHLSKESTYLVLPTLTSRHDEIKFSEKGDAHELYVQISSLLFK